VPSTTGSDTPTYAGETVIGWASMSLGALEEEERAFAVANGMLSTYVDFVAEPAFPAAQVAAAAARGAALLIAWEPYDWDDRSLVQPALKPTAITAGRWDAHLRSWLIEAQAAARGCTIMVRFAPEMNDAIRPWSIGVNDGNTAADYVAMWRHVYAIKQSVAPDVVMVWNPLVAGSDPSGHRVSYASVYPGSEHVDVLALDGFNWAGTQASRACSWQSYDDVFKAPVAELRALAGTKPWGIAEVGSAPEDDADFLPGGTCRDAWGWVYDSPGKAPYYSTPSDWITQAGWMRTMMQQAHDDGALFVNFFNYDKEVDWRLDSTTEGRRVLTLLGHDGTFVFGGDRAGALIRAALLQAG
jgi:hypothetical protein